VRTSAGGAHGVGAPVARDPVQQCSGRCPDFQCQNVLPGGSLGPRPRRPERSRAGGSGGVSRGAPSADLGSGSAGSPEQVRAGIFPRIGVWSGSIPGAQARTAASNGCTRCAAKTSCSSWISAVRSRRPAAADRNGNAASGRLPGSPPLAGGAPASSGTGPVAHRKDPDRGCGRRQSMQPSRPARCRCSSAVQFGEVVAWMRTGSPR